eukprot:8504601-Pyramimonas_sp.AAC.1
MYWLGVNAMLFLISWVAGLQSNIPAGARSLFAKASRIGELVERGRYMGVQIYRRTLDEMVFFT